jgi:hypothetical protein
MKMLQANKLDYILQTLRSPETKPTSFHQTHQTASPLSHLYQLLKNHENTTNPYQAKMHLKPVASKRKDVKQRPKVYIDMTINPSLSKEKERSSNDNSALLECPVGSKMAATFKSDD